MDLRLIKGELTQNSYIFTIYTVSGVTYNSTPQTYTKDGFYIRTSQLNQVVPTGFNSAYVICTSSDFTIAKDNLDNHFEKLINNLNNVENLGYIITEDDVIF
jgi:hypothetical protein